MPTKTKRQLNEEIKILKGRLEKPAASTAVIEPTGTLEDSIKVRDVEITNLKDSIIRNQQTTDTQIAQLQDSLTKSDAAFLTVKAELAQLNDRPVSDGMVLDFINNRIDEDTWQKIGKIKQFGLATVEDSKLKLPACLKDAKTRKSVHEELGEEGYELLLWIENDGTLYTQRYTPILKNLTRKKKKGNYDHAKAAKLFMYLVDAGAQSYVKEFGGTIKEVFPKATRLKVAESLADSFETEYDLGNYADLADSGDISDAKLEKAAMDSAELSDTPQPEDELKPRIPGTPVLPDAETKPEEKPEETAPVADVESPGEKWWREFQEGLNK